MEKRSLRRNVSISKEMDLDLKRLAVACNMPVSSLIYTILQKVMYTDEYFIQLQTEYGVNYSLRAYLGKKDGDRLRII